MPASYTGEGGKRGATVAEVRGEPGKEPDYLSYLLRLWRVGDEKRPMWRASLKNVHTGEQVGFASLEELHGYLRAETGEESIRPAKSRERRESIG